MTWQSVGIASATLVVILAQPRAASATPITYQLNHAIGVGSVIGYVQTDGTIGVLTTANILDWALTLTAPDLASGSPLSIAASDTGAYALIEGGATTATVDAIFFDYGAGSTQFFFLSSPNLGGFWCAETRLCGNLTLAQESIGFGPFGDLGATAASAVRTGVLPVTDVTTTAAVPEPASLLLLGTGLAALAVLRMKTR